MFWDLMEPWKKAAIALGVAAAIAALAVFLGGGLGGNTAVKTATGGTTYVTAVKTVTVVKPLEASLRIEGGRCLIVVKLPPPPETAWGGAYGAGLVQGAGGWYGYLVLDNGTHVVIPPIVARAYGHDMVFMLGCTERDVTKLYMFSNVTGGGFNEQRIDRMTFQPCNSFCVDHEVEYVVKNVQRIYAVVNWYPPGIDGYPIAQVGGVPVRVK
ncbi:hypothetical protein [Pyrobaculum sp.]|uniref:hypothetical protein n=1 Tax=Pyrobaculum sp. TaxID=2004705 RepID=UPI00316183C2